MNGWEPVAICLNRWDRRSLGSHSLFRLQTEFVPNMGVTHGIQKSAILGELAQRGQPRLGEEGSRHAPVRLDLYQTAGIMVWIAGGSFGLLAKDPPRQIRRNMPSATEGKLPKC